MGRVSKYPLRDAGFSFGLWTVVRHVRRAEERGALYYVVRCLGCGQEKEVYAQNLELGRTQSCQPCANAFRRVEENGVYVRFGGDRALIDRLANRYYAIASRCRGVGASGHRYGGRGIECRFVDVYEFVGHCLTLEGHTDARLQVDREDNDGHYEPGNLRFVTSGRNNRNKEIHRWIDYRGERMCAVEFWERFAPIYQDSSTVSRKIKEGLTAEAIIADQIECRGPYL